MKKKFIAVLIISLFMFMPYRAKAADIDYGDCITKFGSITFVKSGSDNNAGGNVNYSKTKNNNSWSTKTVTFDVKMQAPSGDKVQKVNYRIISKEGQSCKGSITGSLVENNKGSVKFSVVIDKGYVKEVAFSGLTISRTNSSKRDNIKEEKMSIKHESQEGESNGSLDSDSGLGDLMPTKSDCDTSLRDLINKYWKWVVFITPLLLIVMMTIDFLKAMSSGDSDAIKKSSNNAIKRVIAAIILLALPWAITVVFTWFGLENYLCF